TTTGIVTLTQFSEIHHAVGTSFTTLANGLVNLTGSASVTDADGDPGSGNATIDLGGNIRFDDDVPSITVSATNESSIVLATQDAETIGAASDTAVSTANFSSVFSANVTPGADAPDSAVAWTYGLSLAVAEGTDSGLDAGASGAPIFLYEQSGTI